MVEESAVKKPTEIMIIIVCFPSSVIVVKAPERNFRYTVIENLLNMCAFFINIIVSPMTRILYSIVTIVYCIYIFFFF